MLCTPCVSTEPLVNPGAPYTFGFTNDDSNNQMRLQNTPSITNTPAVKKKRFDARRFVEIIKKNGITKPPIISNQKNGAVEPTNI